MNISKNGTKQKALYIVSVVAVHGGVFFVSIGRVYILLLNPLVRLVLELLS